jgi:hypothetical protein
MPMSEPQRTIHKRPPVFTALMIFATAVICMLPAAKHAWKDHKRPKPDSRFPTHSDQTLTFEHPRFVATLTPDPGSEDAPTQIRLNSVAHLMLRGPQVEFWQLKKEMWSERGSLELNTPEIKLSRRDGELFLYLDGHIVGPIAVPDGALSLVCHSAVAIPDPQLQKLTPFAQADDFMRTDFAESKAWEILSGDWSTEWNPHVKAAPNAFRCQAKSDGLILTGYDFWHDYDCSVALHLPAGSEAGLVFAWAGEDSHYSAQIASGALHLRDAAGDTLESVDLLSPHNRWLRLSVLNRQGHDLVVAVDGLPLLTLPASTPSFGRVGLVVANSATFDDFQVRTVQPESLKPVASSSEAYASKKEYGDGRDKHLHRWARDADAWQPDTIKWEDKTYKGRSYSRLLYGDFEIRTESPTLMILRDIDGTAIAGAEASVLQRKDEHLLADGYALAEFAADRGIVVGVFGEKAPEKAPELLAARLHQEFFEQAPVDWLQLSGQWANTSRWQCDETWSFFGGVGREAVMLVGKRRFDGNQSHEFYYGMKDLLNREYKNARYVRRDLNFSFCTDGRDPFSGYTLLFGGFANSASYLYAGHERIATNTDMKFPGYGTIYDLHLFWRRIRVEREGKRIRVRHDEELLFDAEDTRTEAPTGGHLMLWTWRNGIVYARMNSSAETIALGTPAMVRDEPATETLWRPLSSLRVSTRIEEEMTLVRNRFAGGDFAVEWPLAEPNAADTLRLAVRIPQGVHVSLHLHAGERSHIVALTAPVTDTYHILGDRPAEPHWRPYVREALVIAGEQRPEIAETITVDLKALFGDAPLSRLIIGNTSQQDYLLFGLSGNAVAAEFAIGTPAFE